MWPSFRHGADNGKRSSLIFTLISTASFCYILIQSCHENRHCDEMIVRLRQLNLTLVDQSCRFEPVPGNKCSSIWIILWCWSLILMKTKEELKSYSNSKSLQLEGFKVVRFAKSLEKWNIWDHNGVVNTMAPSPLLNPPLITLQTPT